MKKILSMFVGLIFCAIWAMNGFAASTGDVKAQKPIIKIKSPSLETTQQKASSSGDKVIEFKVVKPKLEVKEIFNFACNKCGKSANIVYHALFLSGSIENLSTNKKVLVEAFYKGQQKELYKLYFHDQTNPTGKLRHFWILGPSEMKSGNVMLFNRPDVAPYVSTYYAQEIDGFIRIDAYFMKKDENGLEVKDERTKISYNAKVPAPSSDYLTPIPKYDKNNLYADDKGFIYIYQCPCRHDECENQTGDDW